jgi:hypothetical protein
MRTLAHCLLLAVACLALILSLPCAAQDSTQPDISGTWILNVAKSKIDKRFPITSQTVVITYSLPTIHFHYTTNGKDLDIAFTVDGKDHTSPNPAFPNAVTVLRANWKKSAFVTDNLSRMGPLGNTITSFVLEEHWTLSEDGRVLTKKTSSELDSDRIYVFDKQ